MKFILAVISAKRGNPAPGTSHLMELYLSRSARYVSVEQRRFASEAAMLQFVNDSATRTRPTLVLTDSRGEQVSSPDLARYVGGVQDTGTQLAVFAIGPADGWSSAALARADKTIAFGRITLPHELAAVVLAEQIYRVLTIRAGHPYHTGHS